MHSLVAACHSLFTSVNWMRTCCISNKHKRIRCKWAFSQNDLLPTKQPKCKHLRLYGFWAMASDALNHLLNFEKKLKHVWPYARAKPSLESHTISRTLSKDPYVHDVLVGQFIWYFPSWYSIICITEVAASIETPMCAGSLLTGQPGFNVS